jgi:tripartite ATP-independent transporter DctM subunit
MSGAVMIIVLLLAMVIGVPVGVSMGLSAIAALIAAGLSNAFYIVPQQMVEAVHSVPLLAVPYFILAAIIMNETGLTRELFDFASALAGHLRGGLAQVSVVASMIFSGISGAAVADAAGLGAIEVNAMTERGYPRAFSAAVAAASAAIGPIIPPSIPLVIYAYGAEVSTGRVLLAGILPGVVIGIFLMIANHFIALRRGFAREERARLGRVWRSFWSAAPALATPVIIIGALLTGVVTATESGVLASVYALFVGLVMRRLSMAKLIKIFEETALMSGIIMVLIAYGKPMGWAMAFERVPAEAAQLMVNISGSKYVFLLLVIVLLVVIGAIMEGLPALLILMPVLVPVATNFGIDKVQFGLILVYGLIIGFVTPPVGIGLYIMSQIARIRFEEIVREVLVYLIPMIAALFVIAYWPAVSLWIPNLVFGK